MYIVTEIQTNANGQVAVVEPYVTESKDAAENKYHTILAYAAQSTLPKHAAIMYSEEGFTLKSECYKHEPQPQEEQTEEPAE